jgi:outer membrane receptor protein involved in Fe transport
LKRTLVTDQTLEPTQVAGFNQFYDDQESTDAWRYGGAIDQRFSKSLFGGVEFSKRDLDVPTLVVTEATSEIQRRDWQEYLGRAYLFWTPHPWVALSAEYLYERFEQDELLNFGFTEVTTHRVPLGLRFFHPSGFGFWLRGTYVNQDGKFQPRGSDCCVSDSEDFWVVDAGVSYRLPRRYGVLTIGVTNLFDEQFKYQETDLRNPTIQPARAVFARLTLAFP